MHALQGCTPRFSKLRINHSGHCLSLFKAKVSRYSKYELYLLYLAGVREGVLFSEPSCSACVNINRAEHLDFSMVEAKGSGDCLATLKIKTSICCPIQFKVKTSRYSKYELYLLYLAGVCVRMSFFRYHQSLSYARTTGLHASFFQAQNQSFRALSFLVQG